MKCPPALCIAPIVASSPYFQSQPVIFSGGRIHEHVSI